MARKKTAVETKEVVKADPVIEKVETTDQPVNDQQDQTTDLNQDDAEKTAADLEKEALDDAFGGDSDQLGAEYTKPGEDSDTDNSADIDAIKLENAKEMLQKAGELKEEQKAISQEMPTFDEAMIMFMQRPSLSEIEVRDGIINRDGHYIKKYELGLNGIYQLRDVLPDA